MLSVELNRRRAPINRPVQINIQINFVEDIVKIRWVTGDYFKTAVKDSSNHGETSIL